MAAIYHLFWWFGSVHIDTLYLTGMRVSFHSKLHVWKFWSEELPWQHQRVSTWLFTYLLIDNISHTLSNLLVKTIHSQAVATVTN
jgi:hypothetical protein